MKRLLLLLLLLPACAVPTLAGTLPITAPQSTPIAPTPTPMPVQAGYRIQDVYGYLVAPVIVPDSTSDEQDAEAMQELQKLVEASGRSYLTLMCVDMGDYYRCFGYMSK